VGTVLDYQYLNLLLFYLLLELNNISPFILYIYIYIWLLLLFIKFHNKFIPIFSIVQLEQLFWTIRYIIYIGDYKIFNNQEVS
jgi:hypothetical protein